MENQNSKNNHEDSKNKQEIHDQKANSNNNYNSNEVIIPQKLNTFGHNQQQNQPVINRMFASTSLYDRNSLQGNSQRNKLQKSVILFESGVTLGDLEQLKKNEMNDFKLEKLNILIIVKQYQQKSMIIEQEIGNVNDKQFMSMIKDENIQKRLSTRMCESQRLPRQPTKGGRPDQIELSEAFNNGLSLQEQISHQEQIQKTMLQSKIIMNPEISTIQEQNEDLISELPEKSEMKKVQQIKKSSSYSSETDLEVDEIDQVFDDEHKNISDKIQTVPVMSIAERNIVEYKPNPQTSISYQIGPLQQMTGYLKKRSPQYIVGWQKRWCVLKDQKLFYYKNEKSHRQFGVICFNIVSCRAELIEGKKSKTKKLLYAFYYDNL